MLYVGTHLPAANGRTTEPALVDPRLHVDVQPCERPGKPLPYWPVYDQLTPAQRAGYLRWLATGRRLPEVPLGYIFLYYYGLERRLLVDITPARWADQASPARVERDLILAEIGRLLAVYRRHGPFRDYATSLLDSCTALDGPPRYRSAPQVRPTAGSRDLPLGFRLGLGQLVADELPICAEWALAWWLLHPSTKPRAPARQCPDEFAEIFTEFYTDKFGDGLLLEHGGPRLGWAYHPASIGIDGPFRFEADVPDVASMTTAFRQIDQVAQQATTAVFEYSRYVARHPSAAGTPQATVLLPEFMRWPTARSVPGSGALPGPSATPGPGAVPGLGTVPGAGPVPEPGATPRSVSRPAAPAIPDPVATVVLPGIPAGRFALPPRPGAAEPVPTTVPAPAFAPGRPTSTAPPTSRPTSLVGSPSWADPKPRPPAPPPFHLDRERLAAKAQESEKVGALLGGIFADPAEASAPAGSVDPVGGGGRNAPPTSVGSRPASSSSLTDPGSPSNPADVGKPVGPVGSADPANPAGAGEMADPGAGSRGKSSRVAGLDDAHSALLESLRDAPVWSRSDFTALAATLHLLPDGALDALNEAAVEVAGEPVCEGHDPIEMNVYALEEMFG